MPALPSYLPIHAIATDFHEAVYKKKERRKPTVTAEKKSKTVVLSQKAALIKSKMLNATMLGSVNQSTMCSKKETHENVPGSIPGYVYLTAYTCI